MTAVAVVEDWASPKWRLNNLYQIVDSDSDPIDFRMNQQQEHFYDRLWFWNVILKARQVGWTTLISLIALDQCIFNSNFSAVTIAHTKDDATKIFEKKIKFAYDNLHADLRNTRPLVRSPAGELWFANGSTAVVDTSARSGTIQLLHVSEFGKICADRPEAAREIVTGSFPAVSPGSGFVFVESTAEGNSGKFHDIVMDAKRDQDSGKSLTTRDFRLHFYGWFARPENALPERDVPLVTITPADRDYFAKSETESGIVYSAAQRAWYVTERKKLGDDMMRENPATIDEAFRASVEGRIFGKQLVLMRQNRQITVVPWEPSLPVSTFWDLGHGKGNAMALWFHQRVGLQNRLIRYHEAEGEGMGYFANYARSFGYTLRTHYLPHDGENVVQGEMTDTRAAILRRLLPGDVVVGDRIRDLEDGIETTREFLPSCWIDEENCADGIKALENYQRRWNESLGQYMTQPLHNWASNGSDALRTGAQGYDPARSGHQPPVKRHRTSWKA
ncbi:MAG: terminase [Lautropia sp.]